MIDDKFKRYLLGIDPNNISKWELSLRLMCLGENEKALRAFGEAADIHVYRSRYDAIGFRNEMRSKWHLLKSLSYNQIQEAIYLDLAGRNPELVRQHFIWAAENADVSEDVVKKNLKYSSDEVAIAHLWRGYALLLLGEYEEACGLFSEVVPLFNLAKRSRGSIYQTVQYLLPKALIPLCEFKLHPTKENRQEAIDGLDKFVASFKTNIDKFKGYLYYFHLKKSFPEVYEEDKGSIERDRVGVQQSANVPRYTVPDEDTPGSVIIFEKGSGGLEVIGSNDVFEDYLEKVKSLGDYPAIAHLMETYVLDEEQEPEPLIDECNSLLSRADLEPEVRRITEEIHNVATDALGSGDKVILYFDSEVT